MSTSRAWCTGRYGDPLVLKPHSTRYVILTRVPQRALEDMELQSRLSGARVECGLAASGGIGTHDAILHAAGCEVHHAK